MADFQESNFMRELQLSEIESVTGGSRLSAGKRFLKAAFTTAAGMLGFQVGTRITD